MKTDIRQHSGLLAELTAAREAYAEMASGHAGLGGFCVSIANRYGKAIDSIFNPPVPELGQAKAGTADAETAVSQ